MKKLLPFIYLLLLPALLHSQSDNAIQFDNMDDYIIATGASSLAVGSTALSMTLWVYPQNVAPVYPDYDGFAGFRNNFDADFYILQLTSNGIEARFRNSNGTAYDITFNSLLLNEWQHFALIYDGAALTLYHNGVFAGSTLASGVINTVTEPFYMGLTPWTGADFYLNGRLDEVSLWNKSLTQTEIGCIFNGAINPSEPNLLLYYKFNQGIAGGNNTSISSLTDSKNNINGIFNGLSLLGTNSNFVQGITTQNSSFITDTICPGATYIFGNQTITVPGIYFESFPTAGGCDSIVQLELTSPAINTTVGQTGPVLTAQQAGAVYQWIDCLNGNTPISGEVLQTFTATANGQYAVVVTMGNCSDTSVCVTVTGVGITELSNTVIEIGPNPFIDELMIKNNSEHSSLLISIHDITGKLMHQVAIEKESTIRIPTREWHAGIYLIMIDSKILNMKFVKL